MFRDDLFADLYALANVSAKQEDLPVPSEYIGRKVLVAFLPYHIKRRPYSRVVYYSGIVLHATNENGKISIHVLYEDGTTEVHQDADGMIKDKILTLL